MSKKIIATCLSLSLFVGQSSIFATKNGRLKNTSQEVVAVKTEQDKQAEKRLEALVEKAKDFHQKLMQEKITEEQLLESIYSWRDGVKNAETGELVPQITPQEADFLIKVLDLQDLHAKKESIKALMMLKAQADQRKISKRWFKKRALRVLSSMYHKGIMTESEVKELKQKFGLTSISQRLYAAANNALKLSLVIGTVGCLTRLIASSSELPNLVKALKTGVIERPVGEFFVPIEQTGAFQKVVNYHPFTIGFWDKALLVAKFIFNVNENASGTLSRAISVLH